MVRWFAFSFSLFIMNTFGFFYLFLSFAVEKSNRYSFLRIPCIVYRIVSYRVLSYRYLVFYVCVFKILLCFGFGLFSYGK